jgi:hypothetical protein
MTPHCRDRTLAVIELVETMRSTGLADASPRATSETMKERAMGRMEYRVEQVEWKDEPESRLEQLVDRLNEFAKDGWRVASVDLTVHSSFEVKTLPVLLEREAPQEHAVQQ